MKRLRLVPGCGLPKPEGKSNLARIYADILEKQKMSEDVVQPANTKITIKQKKAEDFNKMKQSKKFRPATADLNHRSGKRGGGP